MFRLNISAKLSALFTILIIGVLLLVFLADLSSKRGELAEDQLRRGIHFAQLFSSTLVDRFNQLQREGTTLMLYGVVDEFREINSDIGNIRIWSREGKLLFDHSVRVELSPNTPLDVSEEDVPSQEILAQTFPVIEGELGLFLYDGARDQPFITLEGTSVDMLVENSIVDTIYYPYGEGDQKVILSYEVVPDILLGQLNSRLLISVPFLLLVALLGSMLIWFFSGRVTKPLLILSEKVRRIADGAYGDVLPVRSRDEIGTLTESVNFLSKRINETTLALIERERLAHDVNMARAIQVDLLPKKLPDNMGLDVYAGLVPEEAIGGDMYDIIPLKDGRYLLYVADVTGHGMGAGLLSSIVNTLLYTFSSVEDISLQEVARQLHQTLRAKTKPTMFVTLFLGIWDKQHSKLSYLSCGHPPVVLSREDHRSEYLPGKGIALGMMVSVDSFLKEESIVLKEGDTLFSYSDGVIEAKNKKGELYGKDRLLKLCAEAKWSSAEDLYNRVLEDVAEFMGTAPQMDDITMLVLRKVPEKKTS